LEIEDKRQWHPAFCAAMELEFREDKDILHYEREYNLSKKPLQIDLLVIKKDSNKKLKNEIGSFFLSHNIIEYKSPGDELTVDDLYKVLGYTCIYKSETGGLNEVLDTDITISLVRENKPVKLLNYLAAKYKIEEKNPGIYRIDGLLFPLQILVTKKLNSSLHTWLCSLTRSIGYANAENLLTHYSSLEDIKDKQNAGVVIDFVSNVNVELFIQILKGSDHMTEAMKELIAPELVDLRLIIKNKNKEIENKNAEIEKLKQQLEKLKSQQRTDNTNDQ